ncbi:MAG: GDSL-type esterase/lipase family protein [Cyclobacteriaceae bacterium]|nr:GDSL-type esterase/lipase family protein [Cyclobacteriaceae bacterium]
MTSQSKNIVLIVASLIVSILICEAILRLFVNVRDVGPAFSIYDEALGKALKKNFSAVRVTPEFTMSLTTNSLGFRGPEIEDVGEESVLFLGDSFTLGYGVNDGEEFPALIRRKMRLRGDVATVINAGLGNSGNGWWLNWLKQNADRIDPRQVILQFYGNDLSDNVGEKFYTIGDNEYLIKLPIPPIDRLRRLQGLIESLPGLSDSYIVGFSRQVVHSFRDIPHWQNSPVQNNYPVHVGLDEKSRRFAQNLQLKIVEDVMKLLEEKNWDVIVLLVDLHPENNTALQDFFRTYDIQPIIISGRNENPEMYYTVDAHWNAKGHKFAASLLWNKIIGTQ